MLTRFVLVPECLDFVQSQDSSKNPNFASSPFVFKRTKHGENTYERLVIKLYDGNYNLVLEVVYLGAEDSLPINLVSLEVESFSMNDSEGWNKILSVFADNFMNMVLSSKSD